MTAPGTADPGAVVHIAMDVFLLPVGRDRYELYFEPPDGDGDDEPAATDGGVVAGLRRRFSALLREADQAPPADEPAPGLVGRIRRRLMRFIAERVAEQRLLWRLRQVSRARVHVPGDLEPARAEAVVRGMLQRDADRHLRWLLVHLVGLVLSAPLIVVPGPNLFGYFFTFTVLGHFFALRGAKHGLSGVTWVVERSEALAGLRAALGLGAAERRQRVAEVANRLRLERLPRFFERIAVRTA
ncbi:MAG: hypothetical protein AB7H88_12715 [Vicinamibacterales bacterium]